MTRKPNMSSYWHNMTYSDPFHPTKPAPNLDEFINRNDLKREKLSEDLTRRESFIHECINKHICKYGTRTKEGEIQNGKNIEQEEEVVQNHSFYEDGFLDKDEYFREEQTYDTKESQSNYKQDFAHDVKNTKKSKISLSNRQQRQTTRPIKETGIIENVADAKLKPPPIRMNWNDYHRLDVIHKFIDDCEYDYPSLCTSGTIGQSLENRELKVLKISNSNSSNASVWIDAGIHAREWIAPAVNTYIANHVVTNFASLPEHMTNKDWYFLPVMNPDGYEYSHTVDRMWRKNRAWYGSQCVGVDLNRNFSLGWGLKGSSDNPKNNFYRGPKPFSEPESRALRDMLLNSGVKFKVYITLHSYGQIILFPFAFQEEICPDYIRLLQGATIMSKAIYETNGNTYKVGISRDVMYGAAGTSNDFSYGEAGIPYCYLIELRSKTHKFRVPKEEIEETGKEILNCIQSLMEFVDSYKIEPNYRSFGFDDES